MVRTDEERRRNGKRSGLAVRAAGTLLVLLLLASGGTVARADACSACPEPSEADLARVEGFALDVRDGERDYVETDGGECDVRIQGTPEATRTNSWLVLRGSGEVWTCPHSSSCDTMTATVAESDTKTWTMTADTGVAASFMKVAVIAKVIQAVTTSVELQTVTTISKKTCAAWCRRIRWYGYFEVTNYEVSVDYELVRRYAWWTKNSETGHVVHRKGNVYVSCASGTMDLEAHAPIQGYFRLVQSACADPLCAPVGPSDLGFFPPLPGYLPPPEEAAPAPGDDELAPPVESSADLGDPPAGSSPHPPPYEDPDEAAAP